jgi:hypothetical protein
MQHTLISTKRNNPESKKNSITIIWRYEYFSRPSLYQSNKMKDNKANGVIIGLIGRVGQVDAFESFLGNDKPILIPRDADKFILEEYEIVKEKLSKQKSVYLKVWHQSMQEIEILSKTEINIIQLRCLLNIEPKLGILKQKRKVGSITYLTARAAFFDTRIKRSEVKVYLGELKEYGTNIKTIEKRQEVIDEARWKLFELMSSKMGNTITRPTTVNNFKFFRGAK